MIGIFFRENISILNMLRFSQPCFFLNRSL
jgi:hypothetical protein